MNLIIAGSRDLTKADVDAAYAAFVHLRPKEIISGKARGVDTHGEAIAKELGIPTRCFIARWDLYGNYAGYKRNKQMAAVGTHLLAVWDGKSRGTKQMIEIARKAGLVVWTFIPARFLWDKEPGDRQT